MPTIFDNENDESIEITDEEVNSIFPFKPPRKVYKKSKGKIAFNIPFGEGE